ncbi:hypothetical protein SASC598O11_007760, partial [Snodgrassella alvi SCGC AB-598-O11]
LLNMGAGSINKVPAMLTGMSAAV